MVHDDASPAFFFGFFLSSDFFGDFLAGAFMKPTPLHQAMQYFHQALEIGGTSLNERANQSHHGSHQALL
jgi:hypothetical protein